MEYSDNQVKFMLDVQSGLKKQFEKEPDLEFSIDQDELAVIAYYVPQGKTLRIEYNSVDPYFISIGTPNFPWKRAVNYASYFCQKTVIDWLKGLYGVYLADLDLK